MLALGATALRRAASSAIAHVGGATARLLHRSPSPSSPAGLASSAPSSAGAAAAEDASVLASMPALGVVRHDWTTAQVEALYRRPLLDLVFDAASVHRAHHDPRQVQQCTLLSIKTGGCPETCNYCAQSSSWKETTELKAERLMAMDDVLDAARRAKEAGSTRFCMGTAWRGRVLLSLTLVPIRPRSRGARRSLRTFPPGGVSLRRSLSSNETSSTSSNN